MLVRLLATPERIKRELGAKGNSLELGLLRAMWRVAGASLNGGAAIDLAGLPPGFGGVSGAMPLLDTLQSEQFLTWKRLGGGAALSSPNKPLTAFRIDWAVIERRRRADLQKLDAMQQYAYTKGCRRGFILRYFGDPAARTSCGGCDNCTGTHAAAAPRNVPPRAPAPGMSGKGSARTRGASAGHSRSEETVDDVPALTGADHALLARLRDLRRTISREAQVPAYVVFSDRTLAEIALRRPTTAAALGRVRGVGPVKLERYGERFLDVVRTTDENEAA